MRMAGLIVRVLLLACFLGLCPAQSSLYGQEAKLEEVNFCDLVQQPERYNGHLVRTTATYSTTVHSAGLTGKTCPTGTNAKRYAAVVFGKDFDTSSPNAKTLSRILKKGQSAEAVVIGVVHAAAHERYGYYDAPLQLELKSVEKIKRDPSP
jgi:hypothetical protein